VSDAGAIPTFATLDEAESALDWIGLDFVEGDHEFEGELEGDDRALLEASIEDAETPPPIRDLAGALLDAWEADGGEVLSFVVRYRD